MSNLKNITLFLALYISLVIGFLFDENLNFGSYYDWHRVYVLPITDFSQNFFDTFLNFEKYGQRHSPVYLIFISILLKLGMTLDTFRLVHLHFSIIFIFIFYHCLKLRFYSVDKLILQLLSMTIFLSPTFRSLSIWPDSRLPGLILFTLAIYFFIKFLKKDVEFKTKFAWLCSITLISSSYISPNFSIFAFFFYFFFFRELSLKNFIHLIIVSIILSLPMLYYIFVLDVNFMTAGSTPGVDGSNISFSFNLSDKILIISTIFFFHLFPIIYLLTDYKKFNFFFKKKIIFVLPIYLVLTYFFNYQMNFSGGGIFFQLSNILFNNNILFLCLSFYTFFYFYYFANLNKVNFILLMLIIISNVQNTIYHKYYEPFFIIIIFLLFKNLRFNNFFSKKINILYIYIMCFFYILFRTVKLIYLV